MAFHGLRVLLREYNLFTEMNGGPETLGVLCCGTCDATKVHSKQVKLFHHIKDHFPKNRPHLACLHALNSISTSNLHTSECPQIRTYRDNIQRNWSAWRTAWLLFELRYQAVLWSHSVPFPPVPVVCSLTWMSTKKQVALKSTYTKVSKRLSKNI